ncbi:hypothetical protein [Abyssisolibacter fermentans]|uniref:hypothetical protein n=1 Tax=Abyssisolibacter fermentans TaxID=1766203 RepID=UPI00082A4579|nr:hypothetical protein [Abyssisolibacter fermentans]
MNDKSNECEKVFKFRFIALLCLYVSLFILVLSVINILFIILGIGTFVAYIVLNTMYWKCPYCNRGFEMRHGSMDKMTHCPYCGNKLRNPPYNMYR